MTILKKSWNKVQLITTLSDKLGMPYWGNASQYIKKIIYQWFVQKLEHDYEALLERAISDSLNKEKVDLATLEVANDQIKVSVRREDGLLYK